VVRHWCRPWMLVAVVELLVRDDVCRRTVHSTVYFGLGLLHPLSLLPSPNVAPSNSIHCPGVTIIVRWLCGSTSFKLFCAKMRPIVFTVAGMKSSAEMIRESPSRQKNHLPWPRNSTASSGLSGSQHISVIMLIPFLALLARTPVGPR